MSVAVKTIPKRSVTIAIGSWSGSVTYQNFRRPVAPSTVAVSSHQVVHERPVHDAELRVEDPEEADRAQRDRRRPRQQDQEPDDPAPAEGPDQRVGKEPRTDDDDHLRRKGEDDRVL